MVQPATDGLEGVEWVAWRPNAEALMGGVHLGQAVNLPSGQELLATVVISSINGVGCISGTSSAGS
jgi:hypothetical protein